MFVKNIFIFFFNIIFVILLTAPQTSLATGPSYATVDLLPLAVNPQEEIFFLAKWHKNAMGAATKAGLSFGCVKASKKGILKAAVQEKIGIDDDIKKLERLKKEFKAPKNVEQPSKRLIALFQKCEFEKAMPLSPSQGQGEYTWSPKQFCQNKPEKKCHEPLQQVSVGGLKSKKNEGSAIESFFAYKGVVAFHNKAGDETLFSGSAQGAVMAEAQITKSNSFDDFTAVDGFVFVQ